MERAANLLEEKNDLDEARVYRRMAEISKYRTQNEEREEREEEKNQTILFLISKYYGKLLA